MWLCQHSQLNKVSSKRSTKCPAKIDIKIQKINRNTKRKDHFLRGPNPLPAIIKAISSHNHSTQSAGALKMLRPSLDTKRKFQSYFEAGRTPSQAIADHETELAQHPRGYALLANGKVNPGKRAVYRWHEEWRNEKYGVPGNPLPKLHEQMSQYAAKGKPLLIFKNEI